MDNHSNIQAYSLALLYPLIFAVAYLGPYYFVFFKYYQFDWQELSLATLFFCLLGFLIIGLVNKRHMLIPHIGLIFLGAAWAGTSFFWLSKDPIKSLIIFVLPTAVYFCYVIGFFWYIAKVVSMKKKNAQNSIEGTQRPYYFTIVVPVVVIGIIGFVLIVIYGAQILFFSAIRGAGPAR